MGSKSQKEDYYRLIGGICARYYKTQNSDFTGLLFSIFKNINEILSGQANIGVIGII